MAFRDLRKNKQAQFDKIAAAFKNNNNEGGDNRFWYPDVDKVGNGMAVIRFLPAPDGEDTPTIKLYHRSFQGPTGKWYIENDLSTIGKDDPVYVYNRKLIGNREWDALDARTKDTYRAQKRKESYICNIYVVKDPAHPENEGKVFLFKFGKKIRGMIDEKMNPSFEGEERMNPFDMDEGAPLKIKITKQDNYRNYDKSEWLKPGPVVADAKGVADDEAMENIYNSMHKLAPFIAADQFKTYEQLEAKLNEVVGNVSRVKATEEVATPAELPTQASSQTSDDDDDGINDEFFKSLEDAE